MLGVEVEAEAARALFGRLTGALEDPRAALLFLGDRLIDYERLQFATAGTGSWPALDPDTIAAKGSGRVLVDDGGLLDALTSRRSLTVTGDSVTLATDEVSGLMAQRGARGAPRRNPAPPPSARTTADWATDLLDALVDGRIR